MNRTLYLPVSGLILLVAGTLLQPDAVVGFLNPGLEGAAHDHVQQGAQWLKYLLLADAVMLLLLGYLLFRSAREGAGKDHVPLWQPGAVTYDRVLWRTFYTPTLVLMLLVATVLRFYAINTDLWMDEVFTLVQFVRPDFGVIFTDFSDDNQHVLYSLLAKASIVVLGESAMALRIPAVVFGILSIWATARLARLVFGEREALLSALLITVSYHHVWFSQNARAYTILLLGTLLATDLLLRGLNSGKWRYWIGYAVVIALSCWGHLTAAFVAVAHAFLVVMIMIRDRRFDMARLQPILAILLSGWLTLHLYALILPQMIDFFTQPNAGSTSAPSEWRSPIWLITETLRHLGWSTTLGWAGISLSLLIFAWGLWWFLRRDWLFAGLVILPGALLGFTMLMLGRSLWPRFFFNEVGFVVIIAVVGACALGELLYRKLPALTRHMTWVPAVLLGIVFAVSLPKNYLYPKQDYTGARDFVLERAQAGDQIVGLHMAGRVYNLYYARDWPEINTLEELNQYRTPGRSTWVLYTLPGYIRTANPEIAQVLENEFELMKKFPGTLGDGEIIVRRSHN